MELVQQLFDCHGGVLGWDDAVTFPAVLTDRRNQLFGSLKSEPVICGMERAAGTFALVLESDGPIWALDASAVWFNSYWAEEVEATFSQVRFAGVYAISCFHAVESYAKLCKESMPKSACIYGMICKAVHNYAKLRKAPK